jgi:voltage-gated potassium channel Kch
MKDKTSSEDLLRSRMLSGRPLTGWRAVRIIVALTFVVTVIGGVLIWLVDNREFPDLGASLWWSLQTVTTVGYGDLVPAQTGGRVIGAVLMLQGIGFITIVAAAVTAALIEQARTHRGHGETLDTADRLDRIEERLAGIERALGTGSEDPGPGASG